MDQTHCPGSKLLDSFSTGDSIAASRFGQHNDGTPAKAACHCSRCGWAGFGTVIRQSHGHKFSQPMVRIPRHKAKS